MAKLTGIVGFRLIRFRIGQLVMRIVRNLQHQIDVDKFRGILCRGVEISVFEIYAMGIDRPQRFVALLHDQLTVFLPVQDQHKVGRPLKRPRDAVAASTPGLGCRIQRNPEFICLRIIIFFIDVQIQIFFIVFIGQ